MESREGAGLPRIYGRMRVAGQVIWASRFKETRRQHSGGKAGPGRIDYSYSVSVALALCDSEITRIDRVWANGEQMSLRDLNWRLYTGAEDQLPDPLIEAIEGAGQVPAYRGTAYIVFEDLPLDRFGQRLPQLSFEVVRASTHAPDRLSEHITGVNIIPATGEFVYATSIVRERWFPGIERALNLNNARGAADFSVSLEQLQSDLPSVRQAALTVAWFGDDLRAGQCRIRPGVERRDRKTVPFGWRVGEVGRDRAHLISRQDAAPNFGGTPADRAVLEGIAALKAANIAVTLSPFLLIDVPAGNGLPDPYGGSEQAAFPWRGRIRVSTDHTDQARAEIEAFIGQDGDFGYRHFILHHARLAAEAGGVEAFLLGSEMVALSPVRDAAGRFPFVEALIDLAQEVKTILGPSVNVSYAANWTEYGAYSPSDGSHDVLFPLDDLWASPDVDFVGVDWYPPTGDWRDGPDHRDAVAGFQAPDAPDYLREHLAGGEAFDWYYASASDRDAQVRTPIRDTGYGEDWVFRDKDLLGWWAAAHHPRPGGARAARPTAWSAASKPIRLIEIGFPAVDKGANAPNVFYDPKSSESALPFYSSGARDDLIQTRALAAAVPYWQSQPAVEQVLVWAWDGRPWPDFPSRHTVWSDGPNWQFGHGLNGRTALINVSEIVEDLGRAAGVGLAASGANGIVDGYATDGVTSLGAAITPLATAYDFDLRESGDHLVAIGRDTASEINISAWPRLEAAASSSYRLLDKRPAGLTLSYIAGDFSYQPALAAVRTNRADKGFVAHASLPLVLNASAAERQVQSLYQSFLAVDTAQLSFPPGPALSLEIADRVGFAARTWRIDRIEDSGLVRHLHLHAEAARVPGTRAIDPPESDAAAVYPAQPVLKILHAPTRGGGIAGGPTLAISASPWLAPIPVRAGRSQLNLTERHVATEAAGIGTVLSGPGIAAADTWDDVHVLSVKMPGESLASASEPAILAGLNHLLVENDAGWELLAWRSATLIDEDCWQLRGLRRGLHGTPIGEVAPGACAILADDRLLQIDLEPAEHGLVLYWQAGSGDISSFTFMPPEP